MTQRRTRSGVFAVVMALLMALSIIMLIPHDAYALGLNRTSFILTKGYSTTLKVSGSSSTPKWTSSDTSVATVSSTGKVIGKGAGTAKITANVDGTTLTATVKVVGGKISVSNSEIALDEGSAKLITIRAKGSHGLKAESSDKSVVTTGWVKPWDKDDIHLKLTARGKGTATVKIVMTKYPDVYANVKVTVGTQTKSQLQANPANVTVNVNETANVSLYSSNNGNVNISAADNTVVQFSQGNWANNMSTLTVKGLKKGTTKITITDKSDASVTATVNVTVNDAAAGYYVVSATQPQKKLATDQIYYFNSANGMVKYVLLPNKYDEAQLNTAVAKDSGYYEYYKVYSASPSKRAANDIVKEFTATLVDGVPSKTAANTGAAYPSISSGFIDPSNYYSTATYNSNGFVSTPTTSKTESVKRYMLVPVNFDEVQYNTETAKYSQTFAYWTIYSVDPTNYRYLSTDIVKSWNAVNSNYQSVTHYILLPASYDEAKLNNIMNKDTGGTNGGYYAVSLVAPNKKADTDEIQTIINRTTGQTMYVLLPKNYDVVKLNDIVAKYNGYEYNKVYSTEPVKLTPYDVIEKWQKIENNKTVTHYALLQVGYDPSILNTIKNDDLASSSSSYYIVSNTYPTTIAANDSVEIVTNPKTGQVGYMLIPNKLDYVKFSDAELAFTGEYKYYRTYSTQPTQKVDTDVIFPLTSGNKTIYMLAPQNYDQNKVNLAFAGQRVNE